MNKIFFALAALTACSPAFAQEDSSFWRVFHTKAQKEKLVKVEHIMSMGIIGPDDRQEITGKADDYEKAGVVLKMKYHDGIQSECSGAMVGKNIVLTAAHCLTDDDNRFVQSVQVVATGLKAKLPDIKQPTKSHKTVAAQIKDKIDLISDSHKVFPSARANELWVPSNWKGTKDSKYEKYKKYDYGIIILDSNLGEKTGWLKVAKKSTKDLLNKDIIVLGRGADKPFNTLWKSEGHIGEAESPFIYHDADAVGGNSGGPILLKDSSHPIIAIEIAGKRENAPEGEYNNHGFLINDDIIFAIEWNKKQTLWN